MSAEMLRRAAAHIRGIASVADPGPWYPQNGNALPGLNGVGEPEWFVDSPRTLVAPGPIKATNVEHIATWSPDVAEAVAQVLDEFAIVAEVYGYPAEPESSALRLARRVLGESS